MLRRIAKLALGLALAANGLAMLAAPRWWYDAVPGVTGTGPFNPHFVRDIGAAYLACGAALIVFAERRVARGGAAFAALFLSLHALVHLWDALAGRESGAGLLIDLPTVFAPAALAVWIVWRGRSHNPGENS